MRLYHWFMIILLLCVLQNQNKAEAAPEYLERIDDRKDAVVEYCRLKAAKEAFESCDDAAITVRRRFELCLQEKKVPI